MTLDRLRQLPREQLTIRRMVEGLLRRAAAVPHNIAYSNKAGPGSSNYQKIEAIRGTHAGERCFIVGNGPSLANTDLSLIEGEVAFGVNRIFLLFESQPFRPEYFVCMNDLVLRQSQSEIRTLSMPRFLNWSHRRLFDDAPGLVFLCESFTPHFATDLAEGVWVGATVTYVALQIAYYMGFRKAILIGVDHRYSRRGTPHSTVTGTAEDPDHFDPAYFPSGFRWQLPDLKTSEFAYRLAREAYEADDREILDATIGGSLKVFPKADFQSLA